MYEDLDKFQKSVLQVIKEDGTLTGAQIGQKLWMSKTAVQRHVRVLREKGYIHREGSHRKGIWIIDKSE